MKAYIAEWRQDTVWATHWIPLGAVLVDDGEGEQEALALWREGLDSERVGWSVRMTPAGRGRMSTTDWGEFDACCANA